MTRHLRLASLAAVTAVALAQLATAGGAHAEETAPVSGDIVVTKGLELRGSLGEPEWFYVEANVLGLKPHDSDETLQVYCIDIETKLDDESPYVEGDWEESGVANLEKVRWVLFNGHPNVTADRLLAESGAQKDESWDEVATARIAYVGTQAAVWHFTDGFEFDSVVGGTEEQNLAVEAVYEYLTENAGRVKDPSEYYVDLDGIDEASYEDGKFGPYTIRSTAGPVALDADGGKLVDADGEAVDSLDDGEDFYIVLDDDSEEITITGHASYDLPVGRVFMATTEASLTGESANPMKTGSSQKLILAQPREADIPAEWAFALQAPETEPGGEESGRAQLPATGSNLTVAFAAGLALLIAGLTVIVLARRRSATE